MTPFSNVRSDISQTSEGILHPTEAPHFKKDFDKLEWVQMRTTKMMWALDTESYKEQFLKLGVFNLVKRWLKKDKAAFKYYISI